MPQNLTKEQFSSLGLWITKEGFRFVLLNNLAFIHKDDAVCNLAGKTHFVGDTKHGHAAFGQFNHGIKHF